MNKQDPPKADPRKALGKGLHALLPGRQTQAVPQPSAQTIVSLQPAREGTISFVPWSRVQPNPDQPRRDFDQQGLLELTQSIQREGIIQPIVVRLTAPGQYQIIAGERRWRAAGTAGLTEVPVIIRTADDQKVLELAIVENIQREDLNPIELARAFYKMAEELNLSHDQVGERTGKDRVTVTNYIRLLQLPESIQGFVSNRKLTPGHARALLKLPGEAQAEVAARCIQEGWSVRQIEEFTKPEKTNATPTKPEPKAVDPNVRAAIADLESALGTRVRIIEKGKGKGEIQIEYYSPDDLDRIYSMIVEE